MKKIFGLLIIAGFLFACNPKEDEGDHSTPNDTTEIVTNDVKSDTTEIIITPEEADKQSEEILEKTEDINNQLDEILNN